MATWIGLKAGGTYDWNTAGNWSGGVPNSTTAIADFRADWTAFSTVNISTSVTTNQIFYEDTVSPYNGLGISVTAGRTLTLAGTTPYIDVGSNTGGLYVTAVIAGTTLWEKRNSGILILNAVNTFSGGINVTGGQLLVANNSALGTGSVSLATGTKLSSNSTTGYTLANALSLNGTMTLGDATNTGVLTISGTATIAGTTTLTTASNVYLSGTLAASSSAFIKAGSADLYLTGTSSSYTGAASVTAGRLRLADLGSGTPNQLAGASSIAISSGASLWYLGASGSTAVSTTHTGAGEVVVYKSGTTTFSSNALAGLTSGSFVSLYRDGTDATQTVTVSASTAFPSNSGFKFLGFTTVASSLTFHYTGASSVSASGDLRIASDTTGSTVTLNNSGTSGATLTFSGNVPNLTGAARTTTLTLTGTSTGALTLSGNVTDASGSITNLSKTGTVPVTLSGANTFGGSVAVSAGTLNANSATALGADTSSGSVTSGATLSLGAALNYSTRTFTVSGTGVSTGGALVHAFAGTAKIGAVTLGAATYIRGTASGTSTLSSSIANGGFALTTGAASGNTLTLTGGISGTGGLTLGNSASDTGTVVLSVANTFTGQVIYGSGGTLAVQNATALGPSNTTSNITATGSGTLRLDTAVTYASRLLATYSVGASSAGSLVINNTGISTFNAIDMGQSGAAAAYIRGTANGTLVGAITCRSTLATHYVGAAANTTLTLGSSISYGTSAFELAFGYSASDTGTVTLSAGTSLKQWTVNYGTVGVSNASAMGIDTGTSYATTVSSGASLLVNVPVTLTTRYVNASGTGNNNSGGIILNTTGTVQLNISSTSPGLYVRALQSVTFQDTMGSFSGTYTFGAAVGAVLVLPVADFVTGAVSFGYSASDSGTVSLTAASTSIGNSSISYGTLQAGNTQALGTTGTVTLGASGTLQTLTTGGQNGKLTVAGLTNSAGGTIRIGG